MTVTASDKKHITQILSFWFEQITPEHWFTKSDDFDQLLRDQFEGLVHAGAEWPA